jgi:predicted acetyltransferase
MSSEYRTHPADAVSAERLAGQGLRYGLVDTEDAAATGGWVKATARGFHASRPTQQAIDAERRGTDFVRVIGVWDDASPDPVLPVATVGSWSAQLSVPGETSVTGWAISNVTVAPTHRRKGVARALLEGELRTAHELGIPLAMLTVSEATIYGRFGFAPAAMAATWRINTRRASWTGPQPVGQVRFLSLEQLGEQRAELVERARLRVPGEIEHWDHLWQRRLGLADDGDKDQGKDLHAVRYDDADGRTQGFALYRFIDQDKDFASHVVEVQYLLAITDDAYAALWRYLLEIDLVREVVAPLRSIDEPVAWQIADQRAARKSDEGDHLWVRILDVTAALEGRRYRAPGTLVLRVTDPLGYAEGDVLVEIGEDGKASVSPLDGDAPDGAAELGLSVADLGALYLGGVTAGTLVRAGRVTELRPGSAEALDGSFRSPVTPWLSIWF